MRVRLVRILARGRTPAWAVAEAVDLEVDAPIILVGTIGEDPQLGGIFRAVGHLEHTTRYGERFALRVLLPDGEPGPDPTPLAELLAEVDAAGIGPARFAAILGTLGPDAADIIREAPYRLLGVPGIGWKLADPIALALGVAPNHPDRVQAATGYALEIAERDGHSGIPLGELLPILATVLGLESKPAGHVETLGLCYRVETDAREARVATALREMIRC